MFARSPYPRRANRNVAEGDILAAISTHVGASGLADPGGRVQVVIAR